MVKQCIRHYLGAYKYAITQTFAIPTVDDAEKSDGKDTMDEQDVIGVLDGTTAKKVAKGVLDESVLDSIGGEKVLENADDFDDEIFDLPKAM